MDDLCTTCLCTGRNLFFVKETDYHGIYHEILSEIAVYDLSLICVRICWECRAILRRFQCFKQQAQCCYKELLDHIQSQKISSKYTLCKEPKLKIVPLESSCYPQPAVKAEFEVDEIKTEYPESDSETHCEPETFVTEFKLEDPAEHKEEIVTKTGKKKTKKKLSKKKIQLELPSPENVSDSETWQDSEEILEKSQIEVEEDKKDDKEAYLSNNGNETEFIADIKEHIDNRKLDVNKVKDQTKKGNKSVPKVKVQTKTIDKLPSVNGVKTSRIKEVLPDRPQCVDCGKVFSSRKTYRYHRKVLHGGQNRYPCPRCGKVYQWKSNLGRHLRTHKARDLGELHCTACDKRFSSVATYRQHLRVSLRHVSESEFSFACDECGKKFVTKTRLRDHIDWEHLKKIKFRCQPCDKPFKCHTSLYLHMQNVHENKLKKDNLCHVCGKSYQNAAKLRYHITAMHTTETPYQCEQCNAAFSWYSSLYRHVKEVHYKMKVQQKRPKKAKKVSSEFLQPLVPPQNLLPPIHQPGPA